MTSKTSKAGRPASTRAGVITTPGTPAEIVSRIPTIPQDIIDEILHRLATDPEHRSLRALRACSLVSKSWVHPCRQCLFRNIDFTPWVMDRWLKTFPVPEESPAHYVRELLVWIGGDRRAPEQFFEYFPWFTKADKLSLLGRGGVPLGYGAGPEWRGPSSWRLPQFVTSLTIDTGVLTLEHIRDIMAQLPNLDDLSLVGHHVPVEGRTLLGIGSTLRGRFGGQLSLLSGYAEKEVLNMLLEIPSGLRFTTVQIRCCWGEDILLAVSVAEACCKTLTKLSYKANAFYGWEAPKQSFDFSKLPNLREVSVGFKLHWKGGGMAWLPLALSTLRPATSSRLSVIQLDFDSTPYPDEDVETLTKHASTDLRRIAGEVARIEREFEGSVKFTVLRDSAFEVVLDTLDILQDYCR